MLGYETVRITVVSADGARRSETHALRLEPGDSLVLEAPGAQLHYRDGGVSLLAGTEAPRTPRGDPNEDPPGTAPKRRPSARARRPAVLRIVGAPAKNSAT